MNIDLGVSTNAINHASLSKRTRNSREAARQHGATIFYRHPIRPDEAGMTRVPHDGYAAALKDSWKSEALGSSRLCPRRAELRRHLIDARLFSKPRYVVAHRLQKVVHFGQQPKGII
jgi:hypothetical protein